MQNVQDGGTGLWSDSPLILWGLSRPFLVRQKSIQVPSQALPLGLYAQAISEELSLPRLWWSEALPRSLSHRLGTSVTASQLQHLSF